MRSLRSMSITDMSSIILYIFMLLTHQTSPKECAVAQAFRPHWEDTTCTVTLRKGYNRAKSQGSKLHFHCAVHGETWLDNGRQINTMELANINSVRYYVHVLCVLGTGCGHLLQRARGLGEYILALAVRIWVAKIRRKVGCFVQRPRFSWIGCMAWPG